MKILYIDIASHQAIIACSTDAEVVSIQQINGRVGDKELVPLIEQVLQEAEWDYKDLTNIACVHGPGGFTSLRVGVACANVLAGELGIPSVGVHLSEVYRYRVQGARCNKNAISKNDECTLSSEPCTWLHSTKKDQLFVRSFHSDIWPEPVCISVDDASTRLSMTEGIVEWCGELIDEHKEAFTDLHLQEAELQPVEDVLLELLKNVEYDDDLVLPWYGRDF